MPVTAIAGRAVPAQLRRRGLVSPDGSVAYTVITVPADFDKLGDWGKELQGQRPARARAG